MKWDWADTVARLLVVLIAASLLAGIYWAGYSAGRNDAREDIRILREIE